MHRSMKSTENAYLQIQKQYLFLFIELTLHTRKKGVQQKY